MATNNWQTLGEQGLDTVYPVSSSVLDRETYTKHLWYGMKITKINRSGNKQKKRQDSSLINGRCSQQEGASQSEEEAPYLQR